jgi:hypothetical protein
VTGLDVVGIYVPLHAFAAVTTHVAAKLAEEHNATRYARRKRMIEPIFGNIKANLGYRGFSWRGISAVHSEWRRICAANNLLKLRKLAPQALIA